MIDFLRRRGAATELQEARRRRRHGGAGVPAPPARARRLPLVLVLLLLAMAAAGVSCMVTEPERTVPAPTPEPAGRLSGHPRVIDGDTLSFGSERLRLQGIDAPEINQVCTRDGRDYRCGEEARDALSVLLGHGVISCDATERDRFGRWLGSCHGADGRDIGGAMVLAGWAVAFTRYSDRYVPEELRARLGRRGLWAGEFETPSDYRRRNR